MAVRCVVCQNEALHYSYKAPCCGVCYDFFRQCCNPDFPIKTCRTPGSCKDQCVHCKFEKFQSAGMVAKPAYASSMALRRVLPYLKKRDNYREFDTLRGMPPEGFTLDDFIQDPIWFDLKPPGFKKTPTDWMKVIRLASIQFIKKLPYSLSKKLNSNDLKILVVYISPMVMMLFQAYRCYKHLSSVIILPDGKKLNDEKIQKVGQKLIQKFEEMEMDTQEYLLVLSVLICYPGIEALSRSGKEQVFAKQRIYSALLFEYCMLTYKQEKGPSRFYDLLSICQIVRAVSEK